MDRQKKQNGSTPFTTKTNCVPGSACVQADQTDFSPGHDQQRAACLRNSGYSTHNEDERRFGNSCGFAVGLYRCQLYTDSGHSREPDYVQASLYCRLRVKGLEIWLCGYRRPVDPAHVQQRGPTKAKAKTGPGQGADPVVMAQFLGGNDCRNAEKFPLESLFSPEDS